MQTSKTAFIFWNIILLVFSMTAFADYIRVPIDKFCRAPKKHYYKNEVGAESKYLPKHTLDQGKYGACWAFSAFIPLSVYHEKTREKNGPHSDLSETISIVDLIGKAKSQELCNISTGDSLDLFDAVRRNNFEVCIDELDNKNGDYHRIYNQSNFSDFRRCLHSGSKDEIENWIYQTACPSLKTALIGDKKLISDFDANLNVCLANPETLLYKMFFEHSCHKKAKIHPFNVYREQLNKSEEAFTDSRAKYFEERVAAGLEKAGAVSLHIVGHAISVIGSRDLCCSDGEINESDSCVREWKVIDSLKPELTGGDWIYAAGLKHGVQSIQYILPCTNDPAHLSLPKCRVSIEDPENEIVTTWVKLGNVKAFENELKANPVKQETLEDLFHTAAYEGRAEMVQWFIDHKIQPSREIRGKPKSILESAMDGYAGVGVLKLLIKAGFEPKDDPGALILAAERRVVQPTDSTRGVRMELVNLLLQAGAKINAKGGDYGRTALFSVVEKGSLKDVTSMFEKRANAQILDNKKRNLLHVIYDEKPETLEIVKYLLNQAKVDPNQMDDHGMTVVHYAAGDGQIKLIQTYDQNAVIKYTQKNSKNQTPLDVANESFEKLQERKRQANAGEKDDFFDRVVTFSEKEEEELKGLEEVIDFLKKKSHN